jgi:UTP:GlnB (protein PII) uridylyltransferase
LTPLLDPANAYPEVGFHIVRYCTEEVHRSQPPSAHADPVLHSEAHLSERRLQALLQSDEDKAVLTLDAAGIAYSKREVLVVRVLDEPGMLGDLALVMSKAGINIDSVYVTTRGHIVLGVDDMAGGTQIAAGMAVMTFE